MEVLAYFITWTTHGTWLHGDDRGSVDRDHNQRGRPTIAPDALLVQVHQSKMRSDALVLSESARQVVDATIRRHCDFRHWQLIALNVRTNHVHVLVRCPPECSPEAAMSQFKAWTTRRLREASLVAAGHKVWTEHGSTRWIKSQPSLEAAIDYVTYHQDNAQPNHALRTGSANDG